VRSAIASQYLPVLTTQSLVSIQRIHPGRKCDGGLPPMFLVPDKPVKLEGPQQPDDIRARLIERLRQLRHPHPLRPSGQNRQQIQGLQ